MGQVGSAGLVSAQRCIRKAIAVIIPPLHRTAADPGQSVIGNFRKRVAAIIPKNLSRVRLVARESAKNQIQVTVEVHISPIGTARLSPGKPGAYVGKKEPALIAVNGRLESVAAAPAENKVRESVLIVVAPGRASVGQVGQIHRRFDQVDTVCICIVTASRARQNGKQCNP